MNYELKRNDLIYPELSYQIIGALFEVYKNLGSGYHEKYYQRAIAGHKPLKWNTNKLF